MIIYIASPYSSHADKQAAVDAQIDAFAVLRDAGHQPIAPLLSHYVDQRHPANYERWMQWCMAMVSVADLVVRLPGNSSGADREVAEARRLGKPVVYGVESVVNPGIVYDVVWHIPPDDYPPYQSTANAVVQYRKNLLEYFGISESELGDGSQIRQDYTYVEHQAANQASLDEIAGAMGVQK